ncbi:MULTISPECIES: small multi-drug export protein [Saccharibacillus]|uniref:Small multi-drug export protein n=1 Tax=Saccharibacillus brassicae TaxID=2583377 RepID=A0A4Y6UXJ6_SACBS|nr:MULTISPECIES: small multi-drug export protein [Saccharibacillus]MWJ32991.1 DNA-binding protein [Saccharibacillus sp. WB 17]QDH20997.1 small multi-drug export protein [Saccharibacillus brassicae]
MFEWIRELDVVWQYAALFLLAAAPWLDIFLVVPLGIVWGLSPVAVSIIGFAGNFLMVLLIGLFFTRISAWLERRKVKQGRTASSKKETRARRVWEKYGVPGLALVAPALVGTDIAAVLALSFGSSRRWVIGWMAVSLAVWTVVMAVGSVYGLSYATQ